MTNDSTKSSISRPASDTTVYLFDDWFDPIEAGVRDRVRGFIEAMIEGELDSALLRPRYGRKPKLANEDADGSAGLTGHRHGHRSRSLMGTFGCVEIGAPRARINGEDGKTLEWKSKVLRACPQCGSESMRYFGLGTEKVVDTIERSFPSARLLRWDRDTTKNRRAHEQLLDRFANREADILVGTQMIAKGLDLPGVTLVGVVILAAGAVIAMSATRRAIRALGAGLRAGRS